ncbi:MAG: hypothetical protein Pars2KO_13460 [Parasphingorhabdus sp.]
MVGKKHLSMLCALSATVAGCSMFGGPSDSTIEQLAREAMVESMAGSLENSAEKKAVTAAVNDAEFDKHGLCNTSNPEVWACIVDVTLRMPGEAQERSQNFVVEISKSESGDWVLKE